MAQIVDDFLKNLKPLFDFVELLSKPENVTAIRQAFDDCDRYYREQDQALLAFTIKHGWVGLERHFTTEQLLLLMRWASENGEDYADKRMPEFFSIQRIEQLVNGWTEIPYMEIRNQICKDAMEGYRLGLHSIVVPALLPLAEGLAYEIVQGNPRRTDTVKRASRMPVNHPLDDKDFSDAMVAVIEKSYYLDTDFGTPALPGTFNRHRVLHGRIADYGNAANSIRAFLLVDSIANIWIRLKANPKAP